MARLSYSDLDAVSAAHLHGHMPIRPLLSAFCCCCCYYYYFYYYDYFYYHYFYYYF